jgi:hypothetical protein
MDGNRNSYTSPLTPRLNPIIENALDELELVGLSSPIGAA